MTALTAANLLLGSDEMNRRRKEIDRIASFLISSFNYIHEYERLIPARTREKVFKIGNGCEWVFGRADHNLYFEFRIPEDGASTKLIYTTSRPSELKGNRVLQVHTELNALVSGMCNEYSHLLESFKPYFYLAGIAIRLQQNQQQ